MKNKSNNIANLIRDGLAIDPRTVEKIAVGFIRNYVSGTGFSKVILGLSGGLDSSLVAYFACKALGPKNVYAALLPYRLSAEASKKDALKVARALKIPQENIFLIPISPQIDAWVRNNSINSKTPEGRLRLGNKLARERMAILYDKSAELKTLVIGTSNMSELSVGYGTIFGDTACAFNPIGNLYKTQERRCASAINELKFLAKKTPTADLWPGQTDEGELGITYKELDEILFGLIDMRLSRVDLIKAGYNAKKINYVIGKMISSNFKRVPAPVAKINRRTIPADPSHFARNKKSSPEKIKNS